MIFESHVVVSALLTLQHQLVALRRHADDLETAFGRGQLGPTIEATGNLRHGFDNLAVTVMRLKAQIVAFDGEPAGDMMQSLGELALRAETIVVAVTLNQLTGELLRSPRRASTRAWFAGRFRDIDDVAGFLRQELHRINHTWMQYWHDQRAAPGAAGAAPEPSRARYRRAIREAQQEVLALGRDPDLAYFLRAGIARLDWPEVHIACTELASVLSIQLDIEPDRRLFDAPRAPRPGDPPARKP